MGKIFHEVSLPDPISWSEPFYMAPNDIFYGRRHTNVWESIPKTLQEEHSLPDVDIAEHAIQTLRRLADVFRDDGTNFFLAVGFVKPHLPFQYPDEYDDYYPLSEIPLPVPNYAPDSMPQVAWHSSPFRGRCAHGLYDGITNGFNETYPVNDILNFRAGYYRSLSFCDAMIGRVLDEFRELDLEESTVVSFLGDHGYHLGEQGMWRKVTNFEASLRIPMMISATGLTDDGIETGELVEAVDLFPTLVDLAGLPAVPTCITGDALTCSEGTSMMPLFYNQTNATKQYAFSQVKHEDHMGYTVRNDKYRYTMWFNQHGMTAHNRKMIAEELYDYEKDKHETRNVATVPGYNLIALHLKSVLEEQIGMITTTG